MKKLTLGILVLIGIMSGCSATLGNDDCCCHCKHKCPCQHYYYR